MKPMIQINAYTATSALGTDLSAYVTRLKSGQSGLIPCDFPRCSLNTYIGRIPNLEQCSLPKDMDPAYLCRNNQMAYQALISNQFDQQVHQMIQQHGSDRVGVILGTTTSGFLEVEQAYQTFKKTEHFPQDYSFAKQSDVHSTAEFVAKLFDIQGPTLTLGTACSSSAKAVIHATRMLGANLCDAVIIGGIDSLCLNTLYGFNALELISSQPCRPCDQNRDGLSIGEAGAFLLLSLGDSSDQLHVLGYGESSDAHHMSSPHPEGLGATLAMQQALNMAQCKAHDIDYINLHGTASPINDAVEDQAIANLFDSRVPISSTKGWTGHTLGAAGALELVIACLCIEYGLIPQNLNLSTPDPSFKSKICTSTQQQPVCKVMSNSFGFGGNNVSVIIGGGDHA